MSKLVIKFLIILLIGYAIGITLYQRKIELQNHALKVRLETLNEISIKASTEMSRLDSERAKMEEEAERLKEGSLAYLKQQNTLQSELGNLKKELSSQKTKVESLNEELTAAKAAAQSIKRQQQEQGRKKESELKFKEEEITGLQSALTQLKEASNKKESLFHYNLGVTYTAAGNYDGAVIEYEKAIELDPTFSSLYYNLGIIYGDYFDEQDKALYYYQQYLKVEPNALDAEEVKSWINQLQ